MNHPILARLQAQLDGLNGKPNTASVTVPCGKCRGAGRLTWIRVDGGTCYLCTGTGRITEQVGARRRRIRSEIGKTRDAADRAGSAGPHPVLRRRAPAQPDRPLRRRSRPHPGRRFLFNHPAGYVVSRLLTDLDWSPEGALPEAEQAAAMLDLVRVHHVDWAGLPTAGNRAWHDTVRVLRLDLAGASRVVAT
jgi:hypothetical protein